MRKLSTERGKNDINMGEKFSKTITRCLMIAGLSKGESSKLLPGTVA